MNWTWPSLGWVIYVDISVRSFSFANFSCLKDLTSGPLRSLRSWVWGHKTWLCKQPPVLRCEGCTWARCPSRGRLPYCSFRSRTRPLAARRSRGWRRRSSCRVLRSHRPEVVALFRPQFRRQRLKNNTKMLHQRLPGSPVFPLLLPSRCHRKNRPLSL